LNKLDVVPEAERKTLVKNFVKRLAWKGPVFEISALNREGCEDLVTAIYAWLEQTRTLQNRSDDASLEESAHGVLSIEPDDPRFRTGQ